MYCKNCGADNNPSSAFCRKCGNPLEKAAPAPKPQASGVAQPISAGVLSKGWSDITGTVGWIKKVILLCLIESIPILGFSVDGYILRWGRELSLGENTPMPTEVFKKKEIITGFRAFLIRIMYGIAYFTAGYLAIGLITGLLALISPQFAAAVAILITACMLIGYVVVLLPLTNVAIMRMSVVDYLESGLNIKKIWNAFRKSPGSAIGATFVPIVSASVITGIVWSIVVGIFATFTNAMLNNVTHGIGDAPVGALNGYPYALTSLMGSSSIALFILSFLTVMLFAFVNMLNCEDYGFDITYLYENKTTTRLLLMSPKEADMTKKICDDIYKLLTVFYLSKRQPISKEVLNITALFSTYGILSIIKDWVDSDFKHPPQEMAEITFQSVKAAIGFFTDRA